MPADQSLGPAESGRTRAPGATAALPSSPITASASTPGPSWRRPAPLVAAAIGLAAGLALLLAPPSGTDLPAQQARAAFAAAHPFAAVDFRWFGGVQPAAYSVVVPYIEAALGARLTGVLAAILAAPLLALLLLRWHAQRPVWAAAWGALALVANMASGRTAFAVGLLIAIGALLAVPDAGRPRRHWVVPLALAALTTLTSPVAALFLALVALAWALRRRAVALLAAATAVPMAAIALLFAEPGRMPDTWAVARPVLLACFAVVVLCRGVPVRAGAAAYGLVAFVVFLAPGAIGSNVERLALLFTGMVLIAASWLPRVLLVVAVAVAAQWTARVPLHDLSHSHRLAVERASSQRLVDILSTLGPIVGRVEVVPFAGHGEAHTVAAVWPLARGWERQVDLVRAAPLYSPRLDEARYLAWLQRWNVEYVALGRHTHDWSARAELRLLAHPPAWLAVAHQDAEWTVWRVTPMRPLVGPGGTVASVTGDSIRLMAAAPGVVSVGLHWSRWLTVSAGACIRSHGDVTEVVVRRPGLLTVSSSYLAPFNGRHC